MDELGTIPAAYADLVTYFHKLLAEHAVSRRYLMRRMQVEIGATVMVVIPSKLSGIFHELLSGG